MAATLSMMEPFDTQMLDYQLDDVEMDHVWSHQMDMDANTTEKVEETEHVEIDMENYEPENEYEMSEADAEYTGEMVDVEELEATGASRSPYPVETPFSEPPPALEYPSLSLPSISLTPSAPSPSIQETVALPGHEDPTLNQDDSVQPQDTNESFASVDEAPPEDLVRSVESYAQPVNEETGDPSVPSTHHVDAVGDETNAPLNVEAVDDSKNKDHSEEHDLAPNDADHDTEQDPHEISDGVFIEPPPGILLSFSYADHPDACLFNQPNVASSSSAEQVEYPVILEEHPILYYEPLNLVFEALRQDTYLSGIADLSSAELVMDAHDLQLVISEDNIYAREVSLHELNIIHEASGPSGPLRITLRTDVPRFILRYRELQEKVSRLQISTEEHSNPEQHQDGTNAEANLDNDGSSTDVVNTGSEEVQSTEPQQENLSEELAATSNQEPDSHEIEEPGKEEEVLVEYVNPHSTAEDSTEPEEYVDTADLEAETEEAHDDAEIPREVPVTSLNTRIEEQPSELPLDSGDSAQFDIPPLPEDDDDGDDIGNDVLTHQAADETIETSETHETLEELEDGDAQDREDGHDTQEKDNYPENQDAAEAEFEESLEAYGENEWDEAAEVGNNDAVGNDTLDAFEEETASNESSITLRSKRSFEDVDQEEDELDDIVVTSGSPGSKRARVEA